MGKRQPLPRLTGVQRAVVGLLRDGWRVRHSLSLPLSGNYLMRGRAVQVLPTETYLALVRRQVLTGPVRTELFIEWTLARRYEGARAG